METRTTSYVSAQTLKSFRDILGFDPVSWTRSERRIRCPRWCNQPRIGAHAGSLMTSSRPERCDWYSTKTGAWGQVARDLDLTESALRNWVERARADRTQGRRGLTTEEREELRRLRKENRRLRVERDVLKKAAAFVARESE